MVLANWGLRDEKGLYDVLLTLARLLKCLHCRDRRQNSFSGLITLYLHSLSTVLVLDWEIIVFIIEATMVLENMSEIPQS